MSSLFFQLDQIDREGSRFTAMQREMLRLTLEANPGVTLGAAVKDVFDYLQIKVKQPQLEAICHRLIAENNERQQEEAEAEPAQAPRKKQSAAFGKELIQWIDNMHAAERLLTAVGFNATLARHIYCEQDYLVTDNISQLFLQERWNQSLVQLQAASAPWIGGNGKGGEVEMIDLSEAADDDPAWKELEKLFGPH